MEFISWIFSSYTIFGLLQRLPGNFTVIRALCEDTDENGGDENYGLPLNPKWKERISRIESKVTYHGA